MLIQGKMFTATPPSTYRRRSGSRSSGSRSSGSRRGVSNDEDQRAMPFIPTRSSYSYGSPHSNMPKAPQLADTRVPVAVALQQRQEAAEARMRAEEREREKASSEQLRDERDELDEQDEQGFQDEGDTRRLGPTTTTASTTTTTQTPTARRGGGATTRTGRKLDAAEVQATMNDVRLRSLRGRSVASDLSQGPPTARSIDLMPPPPLVNGRQQSGRFRSMHHPVPSQYIPDI